MRAELLNWDGLYHCAENNDFILAEGGNKIPEDEVAKITAKDEDTLLTYGNGWCDKNVYKSWNKCAVSGKCYETCTDGNCYDEVRNDGREIQVPRGCNDVYMQCAKECSRSRRCKAFTFRNTNVLGNAEFTCMLMDKVLCARSGKLVIQLSVPPIRGFPIRADLTFNSRIRSW